VSFLLPGPCSSLTFRSEFHFFFFFLKHHLVVVVVVVAVFVGTD